jgi:hypothetical protein
LERYQNKWNPGKLVIRVGPKKGHSQNFLSLACDPEVRADYYAFCDQDDVWLPEKLCRAIANINSDESNIPALYCGRTQYVSEYLKYCGTSPLFVFPPGFRNALVQSIAGGNTMVFNDAAKKLIQEVGIVIVPAHDWWVYQLISAVEGSIFYDPVPYVLYRQHTAALVGGNNSATAKMYRLWFLLQGRLQKWNTQNVMALKKIVGIMPKNNQQIFMIFELLRSAGLVDRIRLMQIGGFYRQSRAGTFSLYFAVILNKV